MTTNSAPREIPWFGARKVARQLAIEVEELRAERDDLRQKINRLGLLSQFELDERRSALERQVAELQSGIEEERREATAAVDAANAQLAEIRRAIVVTEDLAILQEAGVYHYRHPLSDAVAYQEELADIEDQIKEMTHRDGGAVLATTNWAVNGSAVEGGKMVRDFSKLMLRAFNAEADNLVRGLKPYKLEAAIDRLRKVGSTIEKLGKTMAIRISTPYEQLRVHELELTADLQAVEKEAERQERERLKEERKVQLEMERERARLEKERRHYENVLVALVAKGDETGAERLRTQLDDVQRAIADVDYRAAATRRVVLLASDQLASAARGGSAARSAGTAAWADAATGRPARETA